MKTLDKWVPIAFAIALSFAISSSAIALSFAHVTGSGDLNISVTGDAYFDAIALDLTDVTLSAATSIVISDAFPMGVPGMPTDTIDLRDVMGSTEVSVLGDAYFEEFAFTGNLTIQADRIHVIGPLIASGSILLASNTLTIGAGPSGVPCAGGTAGAGLVISTGSANTADVLCDAGTLVIRDIGPILIPDTGLVIAQAVPEPSAALLFTAGIVSFAAWNRRR